MPTLTVHLMPDKAAQLTKMAFAERRRPRDQAAIIIERALEAATPPPSAHASNE
jgi:hypothetical protein